MGGGLKVSEPNNYEFLKQDPILWDILSRGGLVLFLEKCNGGKHRMAIEVAMTWSNAVAHLGGVKMDFSSANIAEATGLSLLGRSIQRNRSEHKEERNIFQGQNTIFESLRTGFRRSSLVAPWDEVCRVIIKYLSLVEQYKEIYGYDFALLNHFRRGLICSFPTFLMHSLELLTDNIQKNKKERRVPRYQGLTIILYFHALAKVPQNQLQSLSAKGKGHSKDGMSKKGKASVVQKVNVVSKLEMGSVEPNLTMFDSEKGVVLKPKCYEAGTMRMGKSFRKSMFLEKNYVLDKMEKQVGM